MPNTPSSVLDLGHGFYDIRGHFRLGGVLDIGTQAALVRRANGRYLLLDACDFDEATYRFIDELTDGGAALEAVLHLHPFHTVHVRAVHERYPKATLYGSARHAQKHGDLPFDPLRVDDPALHTRFAEDLTLIVPDGVDFISADKTVHFSSVLAIHPSSKTLYVDDTLVLARIPLLGRRVVRFHPTLARALQPGAESAAAFRAWAHDLAERARGLTHLCAAHLTTWTADDPGAIAAAIEHALAKVEPTLQRHEQR